MKPATRSTVLFVGFGAAIAVLAVAGVGVQFFLSHRNAVGVSAQVAETEFSINLSDGDLAWLRTTSIPGGGQFISWVE